MQFPKTLAKMDSRFTNSTGSREFFPVTTHMTARLFLCFIAFYGGAVSLVYSERQHCLS